MKKNRWREKHLMQIFMRDTAMICPLKNNLINNFTFSNVLCSTFPKGSFRFLMSKVYFSFSTFKSGSSKLNPLLKCSV